MRSREKLLNFSRRGSRVESEKLGDHQRELPGGVEVEVKTLSVLEPEEEIDAGLNHAEAPTGSPLTLSETVPLKTRGATDSCSVGGAGALNNSPRDGCCRKRKVRLHHAATIICFNPRRQLGVKAILHGRSERHCNRRRRVGLSMDSGPQF
jgi:hypothetical protein